MSGECGCLEISWMLMSEVEKEDVWRSRGLGWQRNFRVWVSKSVKQRSKFKRRDHESLANIFFSETITKILEGTR